MAIVTRNPNMWFEVTNKKGKKQILHNDEGFETNYPFGFEVHFSDTPSPQENTVTVYNLSKDHSSFYQKDEQAALYFNWGKSKKLLAEGYISKVEKGQSDGVTITQVLTFTEGTDYNNIKARKLKVTKGKKNSKTVKTTEAGHYKTYKNGKKVWVKAKTKNKRVKTRATKTVFVNKTYRKGTTYKKIIQGIASQAKIKIAKIDLAKNSKIKKSYTAKGKPLTLIKDLVKKTGSKMTYVRGKFEIVNPKSKKRTWIEIDDQDLVQPPTLSEDNEKDNAWEIVTPLIPEITTNVGIHMESKFCKGYYYVKSGQHSFDGDNPQTQSTLVKI
ncbi:MAG: hypothetical protein M3Z53_02700 [Lactobacillus panisapium]|nr:hypothetical protein [Bombilactobacillus sp.]MCT6866097.1 hypothetical protein [Lactobacillus panisapium]